MRENQRGVDRLLAANNRLLVRDALAWEPSEQTDEANGIGTTTTTVLHENVLKLLPTIDALIFAVDSSEVEDNNDNGGGGGGMKFFRDELGLMMDGLNVHNKEAPILGKWTVLALCVLSFCDIFRHVADPLLSD